MQRHLMLTVALLACMTIPAQAQPWEATNPGGGGYFQSVAAGPDGRIVALSDLSGAYISRDRGATWTTIGAVTGMKATHVDGAAFHPTDFDTFFILSDKGIYRTTNDGASFDHVLVGGYVESGTVNTANPLEVYVGWHSRHNTIDGQVYKSIDGGQTFAPAGTGIPADRRIIKIVVAPSASQVIYVLTGWGRFAGGLREIHMSTDGGGTFSQIGVGSITRPIDIEVDLHDPSLLWVSTDDAQTSAGHLYNSTFPHSAWTHLSERGGAIWLDSTQAQRVRMVEVRYQFPWDSREGVWESTDGGLNFTKISSVSNWTAGWSGEHWIFNSGPHRVAKDPSTPDGLFWVNSQFVTGTLDGGLTAGHVITNEVSPGAWQSRGVDNVVILSLAIDGADPNELWAGYMDLGLWRSPDGGLTWNNCNQDAHTGIWDGFGGNTWTVLTDPVRAGVVWAPQGEEQYGASTLLMTTDAGANCDNWTVVGAGLPAETLRGLSLDVNSPVSARTLYGSAGGDVWTSADDGVTWSLAFADGGLYTTAIDAWDGTVYAGGVSGVWRSPIGGGAGPWTEVGLVEMRSSSVGPPTGRTWEGVYHVAVDPHQAGTIYAAAKGEGLGLYRSLDHGATWEPRLLDDDFIRSVVVHPTNPQVLFATSSFPFQSGGYNANSNGVWLSIDGGATWNQQNEGLQWPVALPVVIHPASPLTVYVGAPGEGVHRRDFSFPTSVTSPLEGLQSPSLSVVARADGTVRIEFDLGRPGTVDLAVFDVRGRRVASVLREALDQREHVRIWRGRDEAGRHLASGVYVLRMTTEGGTVHRKFVLWR